MNNKDTLTLAALVSRLANQDNLDMTSEDGETLILLATAPNELGEVDIIAQDREGNARARVRVVPAQP